jgi:hypothetical protein
MRSTSLLLMLATVSCGPPVPDDDGLARDTGDTAVVAEACVSPTAADLLFPPWPEPPQSCIDNHWDCPLEPGYASTNPTTVCNITEGFDESAAIQAQIWEAYNFGRDYFGAWGPVYLYVLGPSSPESNALIWQLRAERRAVEDACYPVQMQVEDFVDDPWGSEELDAANNGEPGMFSIAGSTGCNPLMDMMIINPRLDEVRTITLHEYHHIFQLAHSLTHDRNSDYGLNSWIMEGQATYSAAKFGDETGWGPDFTTLMMDMKRSGGNVSPRGIDAFLANNASFDLADESYWQDTDPTAAAAVYYQLGAWAWAWLVHDRGGDVDLVLKDFVEDVPVMGKGAAFEAHFDRSIEQFFVEFAAFTAGDDAAWEAILQ